MLHRVENLLPWSRDSSESTNYFFLWSTATTSSPTCDIETPLKGFRSSLSSLSSNWKDHQALNMNLDLDNPKCMYEGKYLKISQKIQHTTIKRLYRAFGYKTLDLQKRHKMHFNLSLSKALIKTCLRFPLYTRRSRFETLILNGLELLFELNSNSADTIIDRSSFVILQSKFLHSARFKL